jgi:hypothetical protein
MVAPRMIGAVTPRRSKIRPVARPAAAGTASSPRPIDDHGRHAGRLPTARLTICMTLGRKRHQHEDAEQLDDRDAADIGALRLRHRDDRRERAGRGCQQRVDPGPARDIAQIGAGREHDGGQRRRTGCQRAGIARHRGQRLGRRGRTDQQCARHEHGGRRTRACAGGQGRTSRPPRPASIEPESQAAGTSNSASSRPPARRGR